ncbi:MAG: hypothetical protein AAF602_27070 [Myxococcota bacterium]
MIWMLGFSCSSPPPPPPPGPMVEPGSYTWYEAVPGCVANPPEPRVVRVERRSPIRSIVLNRSGRYHQIERQGAIGWVAVEDPDDSRIITALSGDEPATTCLQATLQAFGDQRWLARTDQWLSIVDLTTARVRHLASASGLGVCRTTDTQAVCRSPTGPVRFDPDGVVVSGQYVPTWSKELYPD